MGEYRFQDVSLPWNQVLRQNQSRRIHERSRRQGQRQSSGSQEGLFVVSRRCFRRSIATLLPTRKHEGVATVPLFFSSSFYALEPCVWPHSGMTTPAQSQRCVARRSKVLPEKWVELVGDIEAANRCISLSEKVHRYAVPRRDLHRWWPSRTFPRPFHQVSVVPYPYYAVHRPAYLTWVCVRRREPAAIDLPEWTGLFAAGFHSSHH
jgi:hypothetical protein